MPLGTILLHSPGCNEGKARNETLGKQGTQKLRAPSGAALTEQVLALCCDCAAPLGLNKYATTNNPGLAPWAMQECRPCRAPLRLSNQYTLLF